MIILGPLRIKAWISFFYYGLTCLNSVVTTLIILSGLHFINILRTIFSHERRFGSFFYIHVTSEKLPQQCWYEKC